MLLILREPQDGEAEPGMAKCGIGFRSLVLVGE